jgi:hypothetical protein
MNPTSTEVKVPQPDEIDAATDALARAVARVEELGRRLREINEGAVNVVMSAELAWALTLYARWVRRESERMISEADELDHNVEVIWGELRMDA